MTDFIITIDLHNQDVEQALAIVDAEIRRLRKVPARFKALKCIHGYTRGSRIAKALHAHLKRLETDGTIAAWVRGTEWNIHNARLLDLIAAVHLKDGNLFLSSDPDFSRENPGITVAIIWAHSS